MTFSAMPELATGATNLLIVISAAGCLISLPQGPEMKQWRLFYYLTALSAGCGLVVHCLVLSPWAERLLWIVFDLCVCPMLALLPLAAWEERRGPLLHGLSCLVWTVTGACSLTMIVLLLKSGFRAQFPVAALLAALAIAAYLYLLLSPPKDRRGLLGLGLVLLSGLTWLLGDFTVAIGPLQLNQAAWLHLGLSLALPLLGPAGRKKPAEGPDIT